MKLFDGGDGKPASLISLNTWCFSSFVHTDSPWLDEHIMLLHNFATFCSYIERYRKVFTNSGTWKYFWTHRLTTFFPLLFYV